MLDILEFLRHTNLETSHPDLQRILTEGFSVNRTGKSFTSVPVDVALEQTIDANAKSRLRVLWYLQRYLQLEIDE